MDTDSSDEELVVRYVTQRDEPAFTELVTRYREVFDLQANSELSVDRVETLYSYLPQVRRERFSFVIEHYTHWLLYRDDAYHDRLKLLFMKAMTPSAAAAWPH